MSDHGSTVTADRSCLYNLDAVPSGRSVCGAAPWGVPRGGLARWFKYCLYRLKNGSRDQKRGEKEEQMAALTCDGNRSTECNGRIGSLRMAMKCHVRQKGYCKKRLAPVPLNLASPTSL